MSGLVYNGGICMDDKKIFSKKVFQRVLSFILAWVIIFNYCDLGVLDWIGGVTEAEAGTQVSNDILRKKWTSKKTELNEKYGNWFEDETNYNKNTPDKGFWYDTSNIDMCVIDPDKVKTSTFTNSYGTSIRIDFDTDGNEITNIKSVCKQDGKVGGNAFTGISATLPGVYYTLEESKSLGGWYRRYYVSTADQLASVLKRYTDSLNGVKVNTGTNSDSTVQNDQTVIGGWVSKDTSLTPYKQVNKVAITLLCDIDLGHLDGIWTGFKKTDCYLEIDGGNHTIYNMYNGYFLSGDSRFIIYDVTFKRCFLTHSAGMFNNSVQYAYFKNVDWEDCVAVDTGGVTIALGNQYRECYFKNCSISNCYVVGTNGSSSGHCGMFASYNHDDSDVKSKDEWYSSSYRKYTYLEDTNTTRDDDGSNISGYYYTYVPEFDEFERAIQGNKTTTLEGYEDRTLSNVFPCIYEDSSTVNCYLYQVTTGTNHSGIFVSCLRGRVIFRNCYSNGSIFAYQQIGAFTGAVIGASNGFNYPNPNSDNGERDWVSCVFENCYSTGTVEGRQQIGGFVGGIFSDKRATGDTKFGGANSSFYYYEHGYAVFKNCYSTASVGMEYTGDYVGGFVGTLRLAIRDGETAKKHKFINCYAAGEVGGIDTDISTDASNTIGVGGFLGIYTPVDFTTLGVDVGGIITNCYYDKQTTAMRERDIGTVNDGNYYSLNGTLGINGVYTETSDIQGVRGLTDTYGIMNSDEWTYEKGYYPQLKVFAEAKEDNFGSAQKAELVKLNSQASTATVFLNHWDEIMDKDGNIVRDSGTTEHSYDTVRDISDLFTFTSEANSAEGNLGWELATQKNKESEFTPYFGVPFSSETDTEPATVIVEFNSRAGVEGIEDETKEITYDTPEVLMIDADDGRYDSENAGKQNGYLFQCYDFAPGKQFVQVTTCTESAYKTWEKKKTAYEDYQDDLSEYEMLKTTYSMMYSCSSDEELHERLKEVIAEFINADSDTVDEKYSTIVNEWIPAYEEDGSYREELIEVFRIDTGDITNEELTTEIEKNCDVLIQYPYCEPTKADEPGNFSDEISGLTASRIFRLIPTAYLDAGGVISVNVSEIDGDVSNSVTLATDYGSMQLPGFDHTVGVLYSSTQSLPLWIGNTTTASLTSRLGTDTIYNKQYVFERDAIGKGYYTQNQFNNSKLDTKINNDAGVFGIYSYFPSARSVAENGVTYDAKAGLEGMVNKVSIGKFYPDGHIDNITTELNNGNIGRTKVEVYKAVPYTSAPAIMSISDDDDVGSYTVLNKGAKVEMTGSNLLKWSGQEKFKESDAGDYFMYYYWRLTDGRYIERVKLVKILVSTYSIEMRTGVANDTTDSFSNRDNSTYIDCDVIDGSVGINDGKVDHQFPSDRFNPDDETWEEYIQTAYDTDDYGEIMGYPDANSTKYWMKSVTVNTTSSDMSVMWRRNADYRLVKLVVEVHSDSGGTSDGWEPMMIVSYDDKGQATIDDANITFQYNFRSYAVSQNTQTKKFSVIETNSAVRQFDVQTNMGIEDTSVKFIDFNFMSTAQGQSAVELSDDIRVTALFKTVVANVGVDKYVLIDDGVDALSLANSNRQSLANADEYRSVDNAPYDNFEDKKAVLFGDKLLYRMKVKNSGLYNASNVVVSDTVPDGCTLVDGSVKIYRQKVEEDALSANATYYNVETIGTEAKAAIDDDMSKDTVSDKSYWNVDTGSDGETNIKWILNPVNTEYDYYVEYAVTVDGDYTDTEKNITNTADYTYAFINGDSLTASSDYNNDEYNSAYPNNAAYNSSTAEVTQDGKIKYTVEFEAKDDKLTGYRVYYISNDIPTGYKLVENSVEVSGLGDVNITEKTKTFEIKPKTDITITVGSKVQVTFEIEKDSDNASVRLENISRLYFGKTGTDNSSILQSAITRVDSVTNEVETDVRWLYLNLEKLVPVDEDEMYYPFDSNQAFLFKLINLSLDNRTVYTDLYANKDVTDEKGNVTAYNGSRLLQIVKRGNYSISEDAWVGTNYDLSKTEYSANDIEMQSKALKQDGITTANGEDGYASLYLPRAMYKSTAFPLWATEDKDGSVVYPTVTCTNYRSEYAYLTGVSSVENSFTIDTSQVSAVITALARAATQASSEDDTNESPVADVVTSGLTVVKVKKDEEE
jgi:uncharacterized repeat protein (TIGR01451 family)